MPRDLRLDFCRGLALLMIFVDHVPDNVLRHGTLHSIGFADAAELFVFIAGYSAMLAYGHRLEGAGWSGFGRVLRRCGQIYAAHLGLFAGVAAGFWLLALAGTTLDGVPPDLLWPFLEGLPGSLVGAASFRALPPFLDILPLYVLLLAAFPLVALLLRRAPGAVLALSGVLWLLAPDLEPMWTAHHWSFNPLAWQAIFVLGATAAHIKRAGGQVLPEGPWVVRAAAAVVAVNLVLAAPWTLLPGLADWAPAGRDFIYSVSKPNLAWPRLVDFLALAILVARLAPPDAAWYRRGPARLMVQLGQHSLPVFCLGILLTFAGAVAFAALGTDWPAQLAVNSVGFVSMAGLAALLAWRRQQTRGGGRAGGGKASGRAVASRRLGSSFGLGGPGRSHA